MTSIFQIRSIVVKLKDEQTNILLVSNIFVILIFASTGALSPGLLAKVDFLSDMNFTSWTPGWSQDNFGTSLGLANSINYYLKCISFIPVFPFKSFVFFFLIPMQLVGVSLFYWVKNQFKNSKDLDSKLIGSYSVLFLFTSVVFAGVFLYGWNLISLIPISGMLIACLGIDLFCENSTKTRLGLIALGAFMIGGMIHFLIFPVLYAIRKKSKGVHYLKIYSTIFLAESYVLIPEIFLSLFGNQPFYRGINPIEQTRLIQDNLIFINRVTGTFDPLVRGDWNQIIWFTIFFLGVFGFFELWRRRDIHIGFVLAFVFFSLLNFSGLYWNFSLNKLWTYLPFVGGMFRNPDKIFILLFIPVVIFASYIITKEKIVRLALVVAVLASSSFFYLGSSIKPELEIANFKIPPSYSLLEQQLFLTRNSNRVLLLPFPKWFHRYGWSKNVQTQNILRHVLSSPVISDEMETLDTLPFWLKRDLRDVSDSDCEIAKSASRNLSITHIVIQNDVLNPSLDSKELAQNLNQCFGDPFFESVELIAFETGVSEKFVQFYRNNLAVQNSTQIFERFYGFKVCNLESATTSFQIKEQTSSLTYFQFETENGFTKGHLSSKGWRLWDIKEKSCSQIINFNLLISIFTFFFSFFCLVFLLFPLTRVRGLLKMINLSSSRIS